MEPGARLQQEIRAMVTECAVCDRDARDAQQQRGIELDLGDIAHPEDAFDTDLLWHRRERHRERLLERINQWIATTQSAGG
ncbi:MAG: hypothetical protein JO121_22600 [Deltaproteobacteria bacterium]|nr:hypothetical protein [Deltaproteobacteria bacterium]